MARYERQDGKDVNRATGTFWEIERKGSVVEQRTGKIGPQVSRLDGRSRPYNDSGRLTTREHADAAAAQRAYDKLVAAKLAAGFVLAPGSAPAVPQIACQVARNLELEATIAAHPDDVASYLVYGDWLQERGDRRGELVHLQHAMRANNDPATFLAHKRLDEELRAAHAHGWLGALVATNLYRMKLDWRLGFVETARIDAPTYPSETALAPLVLALLAAPAGCLLRTLVLRAREAAELADALDALPQQPSLRTLSLVTCSKDGPVHALVAARPALGRLAVRVDYWLD